MQLLGILRPPGDDASQWYRPRPVPSVVELADLIRTTVEGTTVLDKSPTAARLGIDIGEGRNLEVAIAPAELRFYAELQDTSVADEEHGGEDEDESVNAAIDDCFDELVELLQPATGFYLFETEDDLYVGYEPIGACAQCQREFFDWQDVCADCGTALEIESEGEDEDEDGAARRAQLIVHALLDAELLELATPSSRGLVEGTLAASLAKGKRSAAELLDLLVSLDCVAEVYCDEKELAKLLRRMRR